MISTQLGEVVSTHEVPNRRALAIGVVALVVGVVASFFTVVLAFDDGGDSVDSESLIRTTGMAGGLAIVGLAGGVALLVRTWRRGLTEVIEVRERGLVHRSGRRFRWWYWDSVLTLDEAGGQITGAARHLGIQYRCVIRFDDEQRVVVDNTAEDFALIAEAVRHYCPSVGPQPRSEQRWRRLSVVWLALGLLLVGGVVGGGVYWSTQPSEKQIVVDGIDKTVPTLDDGQIALIALGMLVALVAGVMCLSIWFVARIGKREE